MRCSRDSPENPGNLRAGALRVGSVDCGLKLRRESDSEMIRRAMGRRHLGWKMGRAECQGEISARMWLAMLGRITSGLFAGGEHREPTGESRCERVGC